MDSDSVKLVATREFPCDAVVNTSKADADTLATILVDDINECAASRKSSLGHSRNLSQKNCNECTAQLCDYNHA